MATLMMINSLCRICRTQQLQPGPGGSCSQTVAGWQLSMPLAIKLQRQQQQQQQPQPQQQQHQQQLPMAKIETGSGLCGGPLDFH
ncbi:hypothetical protein AWZ03_003259 [Drosophila navojoa]|uniref:Uncharacterized protein n=1 Tax=Drosophila navojoa TaxID=7232 RepID=A0A484BNW0_DRONA|nr:hypothetical protein AWZ03_003259 [Drosophila navojoa]